MPRAAPLSHPRDRAERPLRALRAVGALLSPVVSDPGIDLHLVDRQDLCWLLDLITDELEAALDGL